MRVVTERGVPPEERIVSLGGLADWDAARIFLEVVRCGSFRSAAERLELSINAVRRRIDDFERQIGATLFTRDVHGTRLTDEGALVVSAVERMESVLCQSEISRHIRRTEVRRRNHQAPPDRVSGHRTGELEGIARRLVCWRTAAESDGDENQCRQRELLGGRQRDWHWRVSDLSGRARREDSTARHRVPSAGGYLAIVSPG